MVLLLDPVSQYSGAPVFAHIPHISGRFCLDRLDDCFPLFLGKEFFGFALAFVFECGDSFRQEPFTQMEYLGAGKIGQYRDVFYGCHTIQEQDGLSAFGFGTLFTDADEGTKLLSLL